MLRQRMPEDGQRSGSRTVGPIVVAFDATQSGRQALRWALGQAARSGASLHVICTRSSADEGDDYPYDADDSPRVWLVRGLLDELVASEPSGVAPVDLKVIVTSEDAILAMVRESEVVGSVLVLGRQRESGETGLCLEQFSEEVLRRSRCSVIVAPAQPSADDGFDASSHPIVASVDRSDTSESVLRFAAVRSLAENARLLVVAILPRSSGVPHFPGSDRAQMEARAVLTCAKDLLDSWSGRLEIETAILSGMSQSLGESERRGAHCGFGSPAADGGFSRRIDRLRVRKLPCLLACLPACLLAVADA